MLKFELDEWVAMNPADLRVSASDFTGHADAQAAAVGFNKIVDVLIGMAEQADQAEIGFDGARLESAVRATWDAVGGDPALSEMTAERALALAERVF